jgi:hypothetical protein
VSETDPAPPGGGELSRDGLPVHARGDQSVADRTGEPSRDDEPSLPRAGEPALPRAVGTWRRAYLLVLGALAAEVVLLWLLGALYRGAS